PAWLPDRVAAPPAVAAVHRLMVDLLDEVTTGLTEHVSPDDALSLAGRALFARFLLDRGVVTPAAILGHDADGADLFRDARRARQTCAWLDHTFNGNLLPLSVSDLARLPPEVWSLLVRVLDKASHGDRPLPLDWPGIDFAHVPVGLLSEVYEAHCGRHAPETKRRDSVHYTPRHLAEYMVRESLGALEAPERARVFDPACGGGVFLVAALRELVRHRWRADGQRPSRAVVRDILRQQLVGLDVQPAALRLAALALYLTAIELDPDPGDADGRRFDDLLGSALHDVRHLPLGSLDPEGATARRHRFDLVVGNPPWTARPDVDWGPVDRRLADLCAGWGVPAVSVRDKRPDLPFLWFALDAARPGGQVALVVHGRFLYERGAGARHRQSLFRAAQVSGVLNGSTVSRNKRLWPEIKAPFALVFARAAAPASDALSWFITPLSDPDLNRAGRLRVDPDQDHAVPAAEVAEDELALRVRMRGTSADLELIGRLRRLPATLGRWWGRQGLPAGHQGYRRGGAEARRAKTGADFAEGWPHLTPEWRKGHGFFAVDPEQLPPWTPVPLELPRDAEIFQPPLVVMPETIPRERQRGRAAYAAQRVYFSESFYGWSCQRAADPELTAAWLHLLLNTDLPRYWALMTSAQYGVEREAVGLRDLDTLPVPSLDVLARVDREQVLRLSRRLRDADGPVDWTEIDAWWSSLYGLRPGDLQLIRDTLGTLAPELDLTDGQAPRADCRAWWGDVARRLAAATRVSGALWRSAVTDGGDRWSVCTFSRAEPLSIDVSHLLAQADDLATAEVLVWREGALHVARLRQRRYWTETRARLFVSRLVRDHGDRLAGYA
ncbi:MAG TPA: N-6 DNA methylase, partial [Myxococcota bacterium]|nr:N-6 DNA methylase [Myxococcota bacterium]